MRGHIMSDSWQSSIDDSATRPGMWLDHLVHRKIFRWSGVQKGETVVDVGVGRGYMAHLCIEQGAVYCGVDSSASALAGLPEPTIRREQSVPPLRVPIIPDVIFLISVLEHMDTATRAFELLSDCRTILAGGGSVVVMVPASDAWFTYQFNSVMWQHQTRTTLFNVGLMLYDAGFRKVRFTYISGPVFSYWPAVFLSFCVKWMPFMRLELLFPRCKWIHKLSKGQQTFMRMALFEAVV